MIRIFQKTDIERVMHIWLESNIKAHSFVPKEYWMSNYDMVKEQILQAEIYVYETEGNIKGFVGIMDHYIAGIFVDEKYRSVGIGSCLLEYSKSICTDLTLSVYQQNKRAVDFYLREGFAIISEGMDEETGEKEYTMAWRKNKIVCSSEDDNEYIHSKLREYNGNYMRNFEDFNFHIKEGNKIVAGIVAESVFDTLEIEFLFVDKDYRGRNLGTKLLQHVENAAREKGLKRILLNTYSFQAPEFYKKAGYTEILKIDPCFEKFTQFYFMKEL